LYHPVPYFGKQKLALLKVAMLLMLKGLIHHQGKQALTDLYRGR